MLDKVTQIETIKYDRDVSHILMLLVVYHILD